MDEDYTNPELSPEERTKAAAAAGTPTSNSPDPDSEEGSHTQNLWDSDEAFENLTMERSVHPDETAGQMTKRLLEDAGPAAASSIIHIALHSANDNTRLNAAKYITDLVYQDGAGTAKATWEDLVAETVSKAEILANQ